MIPRVNAAIHEAGHCTSAWALGMPVHSITINDNGGGVFRNVPRRDEATQAQEAQGQRDAVAGLKRQGVTDNDVRWLTKMAIMIASGPVAGFCYSGSLSGCDTDFEHLQEIISVAFDDAAQQREARNAVLEEATTLVERNRNGIRHLAAQVFFKGRLNADEIRESLQSRVVRCEDLVRSRTPAPRREIATEPTTWPVVDHRTGSIIGIVTRQANGSFQGRVRDGRRASFDSPHLAQTWCVAEAPESELHYRTDGCFVLRSAAA